MTDPARPSEVQALAELVHDAYHDTKETGVTIVADLAAGIAARLHAHSGGAT